MGSLEISVDKYGRWEVVTSTGGRFRLADRSGNLEVRVPEGDLLVHPKSANVMELENRPWEDFRESNLKAIQEELAKPPIRKSGVIVPEGVAVGSPEFQAIHLITPITPADREAAKARVQEFLRQRAMARNLDPDEVVGINADPNALTAVILVDDLKLLAGES